MNALTSLFRGLFGAKPVSKRRPLLTRPTLEGLEERMVPAASSLNLHAVALPNGTSAAFMTNPVDHAFYEITPTKGLVQLAGPTGVTEFSAGVGADGKEDVFAHFCSTMYEHDTTGWHFLSQPMAMNSFAAVDGGRCYATGADHSLWSYTPPTTETHYIIKNGHSIPVTVQVGGWSEIAGANTAVAVDAVTETNGIDIVFIKANNGDLRQYITATQTWTTLATANSYTSFSAGLDTNGYADAYIAFARGWANSTIKCWHDFGGGSMQMVADVDGITTMSATHDGHVAATVDTSLGSAQLFVYGDTASNGYSLGAINVTAVAAVRSNDVFATGAGQLFEITTVGFVTIRRTFGTPTGTNHW